MYRHTLPGLAYITICLQILNLSQALKDGKSPVQLVQLPAVIVERSSRRPGTRGRIKSLNDNFIQSFQNKAPFFSWC